MTISNAYEEMMKEGLIKRPPTLDEKNTGLTLPNIQTEQMDKIELLLEKIIKHFKIK